MFCFWWKQLAAHFAPHNSRKERRKRQRLQRTPQLETLEARDVPALMAHTNYVVEVNHIAKPDQSGGPSGYSPSQIEQAYGFNQISFNGTPGTGAGTTIAIVDAYSDPNITSDLNTFDSQFGLPVANLKIVNQSGGSSLPSGNTGWAGEISLDVEWAHAIAPGASILLVEANSASYSNLFTAVKYAAKQPGVVAVSMSWGGSEFSGETSDDSTFTPPSTNPDVVFVNAAGDSGSPADYPSTSPDVLSVGGTSLNLTSSGTYVSESAWDDAEGSGGGGISVYESQPAYQKGVVTQSTTKRTDPDVSYDADPATGFPVYQTYGGNGWLQYGGTSDASPQWAALIAIADQGRGLAGEVPLTNATLMPMLYQAPAADFHDITTGHSGGTYSYPAGPGYDLATGIGTPIANNLVATLVGTPPNGATHFSIIPSSTNENQGTAFSITVTALTASNTTATNYTGTIHFTSSDLAAKLPSNFTFTASDDGTYTFTSGVTLNTPGTDTVTATDTLNGTISGTASYTVSAPYFTVAGIPSSVNAGTSESFTVTAYNANGTEDSGYTGLVEFTSSDSKAQFSANDVGLTGGVGSFSVIFETSGTQKVTAADSVNTGMTGSETGIIVSAGPLHQLVFLQQPANALVNASISPAVTVEELDQYGNVLTNDNTGSITLTLTASNGATLSGGGPVTVSHGIATFSSLSVNAAGSYTLTATEGTLTAASSSFTITTSSSNIIENFQNGLNNYYYVGNSYPEVYLSSAAAHTQTGATQGLVDEGDGNWYFREDSGAVIHPGDTVTAWVEFSGTADGRAYFGFGTTGAGLDSIVLAPNTGQFIIQNNSGFNNYTNLAAVNELYLANQWYMVQLQWGSATGEVVASLYSSNGTTLLNQVTAATGDLTPGTFAFRAIGSNKYFSTVTDTPGVNNFAKVSGSGNKNPSTVNWSQLPWEAPILPLTSGIPISSGGQGGSTSTTSQNPWLWFPPGQTSSQEFWQAIQEEIFQAEEGGLFLF
jgi:hypothetical protein